MPVDEISLGDYVLAGGEAAVLVIVEAVARLLPGVLGNAQSAPDDSFGTGPAGLLEAPAYTKPAVVARARRPAGAAVRPSRRDRALAGGALPRAHRGPPPGPAALRAVRRHAPRCGIIVGLPAERAGLLRALSRATNCPLM